MDKDLKIAFQQLEEALRLFLERQDCVCSATLAGAAEEILGKKLNKDQRSLEMLKISLSAEYNMTGKEVIDFANSYRNSLKHGGNNNETQDDSETWAISLILRALTNLTSLGFPLSDNGHQFLQWIYQNRSELS